MSEFIFSVVAVFKQIVEKLLFWRYSEKKEKSENIINDLNKLLENLLIDIWQESNISEIKECEVGKRQSTIVYQIQHLEEEFENYDKKFKLKVCKEEINKIIEDLREVATLDIEKLVTEKEKGDLFETKLNRKNRVNQIKENIKQLKEALR